MNNSIYWICPTHVGMNRPPPAARPSGQTICPTHVGMNRSR